ncbi:MAG: M20/M25/M40 family metallo-hydrolase [Pyramidobacter sp.]|nr:M20/M25/M40 family metallo-hydrolase [Pyramidobacter sp.]
MATNEERLLEYFRIHEQEMLDDLKTLVEKDSPSLNRELAEQCADVLEDILRKRIGDLGTITAYPNEKYGRNLLFRNKTVRENKIAITGHYDTVWDKGAVEPMHLDGDHLHGPGVLDMKSGDVYIIWALKALHDLGIELKTQYDVCFTSDEEISGLVSRPLMKELFAGYSAALVAEPGEEKTGRIATRAPGLRRYIVEITGKAAHSGAAHKDGINAIWEMARQIDKLQRMTDYSRGLTFSVGVCKGGEKINIVPDYARFDIDTRFLYSEDGQKVYDTIMNLKSAIPGTSIKVTEIAHQEPIEKTPANNALYAALCEAGKAVGYEIGEFTWGACSDANYFARLGMPVLCSLGCCGDGIHQRHEYIDLKHFVPRAAVLASLLTRL